MNQDSPNLEAPIAQEMSTTELARLAALDSYCVLDTQPDVLCDLVTELATRFFDVDIALVSLVAKNRQWFKSRQGLEAIGTPRSQSFCSIAIEQEDLLVVQDAREDQRFSNNPLVLGEPRIRFYAGASLVTPCGLRLGTLCLIGKSPREQFTDDESATLQQLAAIVMARLEILRVNSYVDGLTKLPNRSQFAADLQSIESTGPVALHMRPLLAAVAVDICDRVYLDDMVKALGWDYAEGFLIQAKDRLAQALGDVVLYRIDTTVFAFLEKMDAWQAKVEEVKRAVAVTLEHQAIPHHLEISVGIVPLAQCANAEELMGAFWQASFPMTRLSRKYGSSMHLRIVKHADFYEISPALPSRKSRTLRPRRRSGNALVGQTHTT